MLVFIHACKMDQFENLDTREMYVTTNLQEAGWCSYLVYLAQDGDKNRILTER
jgi:hypothetical protein